MRVVDDVCIVLFLFFDSVLVGFMMGFVCAHTYVCVYVCVSVHIHCHVHYTMCISQAKLWHSYDATTRRSIHMPHNNSTEFTCCPDAPPQDNDHQQQHCHHQDACFFPSSRIPALIACLLLPSHDRQHYPHYYASYFFPAQHGLGGLGRNNFFASSNAVKNTQPPIPIHITRGSQPCACAGVGVYVQGWVDGWVDVRVGIFGLHMCHREDVTPTPQQQPMYTQYS